MKKLSLTAVLLLVLGAVGAHENRIADRPIRYDQLPRQAQQFLREYYADVEVTLVGEDGLAFKEYEVFLADGTKVEFAADGRWQSVESREALPKGVVPTSIESYVVRNYPKAEIVGIDRDRRHYDVKLRRGLQLTFDNSYRLVEIDD